MITAPDIGQIVINDTQLIVIIDQDFWKHENVMRIHVCDETMLHEEIDEGGDIEECVRPGNIWKERAWDSRLIGVGKNQKTARADDVFKGIVLEGSFRALEWKNIVLWADISEEGVIEEFLCIVKDKNIVEGRHYSQIYDKILDVYWHLYVFSSDDRCIDAENPYRFHR